MTLFKTSFLSAIETIIKLLSGLVIVKYLALKGGPDAIAVFGQFHSFYAAVVMFTSGAYVTGLVKNLAEAASNENKIKDTFQKSIGFGIILCLFVLVLLIIFSEELSVKLFQNDTYQSVFISFSFSIFFIAFYYLLISALNGLQEIKKYILSKMIASVILLFLTSVLIYLFGQFGALLSLTIAQAISCLVALYFVNKVNGFSWKWFIPSFKGIRSNSLFPFWIMAIVTAISSPIVLMLLRNIIIGSFGWTYAGYWEAAGKISELYLVIITTGLLTYYLPKLSVSSDTESIKQLVLKVTIFAFLVSIFCGFVIYIFRYFVIFVLFDDNFTLVADVLGFQIIGSVIRVVAWVYSYYMITKGRVKIYVFSELAFGGLLVLLTHLSIGYFGFIGVFYAYVLNSVLFCMFVFGYYWIDLKIVR